MKKSDYFANWSKLHGGAKISGVVKGWLSISFTVCNFLRSAKITPNFLSFLSLVLASGYLALIDSHWAIVLLVLSLAADGLDGTLAIITNRVSKWGALLDAVMDRIVEGVWAYGLFLLGAPLEFVVVAYLAAFTQEYLRARAGGLGVTQVGIVTIAERPVRASLIFIALVARLFAFDLVGIVALTWMILQLISVIRLVSYLRPLLQQSQR